MVDYLCIMNDWTAGNLSVRHGDFIQSRLIPDSVDLIVTSPPYNVGIAYSQYEDSDSYADYVTFSQR